MFDVDKKMKIYCRRGLSLYRKLRPLVSGIQIHVTAARTNAPDDKESAVPNPCVCARVPTVNGASALASLPML
jgi:hypothetical protein